MPLQNFELKNGEFILSGYQADTKLVSIGDRIERRMNQIRVGQSMISRAVETLHKAQKEIPADDHIMWSAVACAVCGWYFACFASSDLGPKLDATKVFHDNQDAIAWHRRWKEIRDKHIHHPANVGRSIATGTIVDGEGNFIELFTASMESAVVADFDELKSLYMLLDTLSTYLSEQADNTNSKAHERFKTLDKMVIDAAPPLKLDKFSK